MIMLFKNIHKIDILSFLNSTSTTSGYGYTCNGEDINDLVLVIENMHWTNVVIFYDEDCGLYIYSMMFNAKVCMQARKYTHTPHAYTLVQTIAYIIPHSHI